nr:sulfate/thiosulfate ABC transporter permease CysW [Moraxellaceae bacterium]
MCSPQPVRWALILLAAVFAIILFVLPLAAIVQEALRRGWEPALTAIVDEDALSAMRLTLLVAAIAVPVNTFGGIAAAWAIAKCEFPGKRLLTTLIELPFSVSPVIS